MAEDALTLLLSPRHSFSKACYETDDCAGSFVDTGNLVLSPAGARLQVRASGGPIRLVRCCYERSRFKELTGFGDRWDPIALTACLDIKNSRIAEALSRLAQEALAPGYASSMLTEGLGVLTAVELSRYLRGLDQRARSHGQTLLPWQMRRITDYIDRLSGYVPDIASIAELCGISSRHVRRLFKQTTNQTISEYARSVWIAKAKQLMCDTDLSLKEISSRLGFSDPSSFSIAFRRATGEAPKAFRQQFRRPKMH